jgi:hypothetical protein
MKSGFLVGTPIAAQLGDMDLNPVSANAITLVDQIAILPGAAADPIRAHADLFYFHVWMLPPVLDVQNPKIGQPIEFQVWNAFLDANTVQAVTPTNATGVTLDLDVGDVVPRLALQTVIAIIDSTAPTQIDANFLFDFTLGDSELRFLALLADILPIPAEGQITETLEWKTDIMTVKNGAEQRIALRQRPRRSFGMTFLLLDDAERKVLYDKMFKTAALTVIAPAYQYQSRVKVKTVIGDNKLYTNPRRADLRVGENVVIATKQGQFFLYEVATIEADHVTVTTAFSQQIPKGAVVCGAFDGRFPNKSGLNMLSIAGNSSLNITLEDVRDQLPWPGYTPVIPTFKGKPLLRRRALAESEAREEFDVGMDVMDNEVGKPYYFTSWTQPFVEGARQYLIQTLFDQDELEFWRGFLDTLRGQQKTFYTPTYRNDLISVVLEQGNITVAGTEYHSLYFEHTPYQQIQIETDKGTFEVDIVGSELVDAGSKLHFGTPIETDLTDAVVSRVSYVMLVRLGSDKVSLTHSPQHTIVELSIRMAVG